jgi:DNA-binding MarR family transcriptional regulator
MSVRETGSRTVARRGERHLEILTAVGEGEPLTQRALAERLGVALGLANLYLKRLVTKGYIKVTDFGRKPAARKRLRYLLTPKGLAEKTRLTYEYMNRSVALYRLARVTLRRALAHLPEHGLKRIALYGTGEAAELAYLTLKEFGLEPLGIFTPAPEGRFLGWPVRDVRELGTEAFDAVIVATFDKPKLHVPALLALGIPADKIITIQTIRKANGLH